MLRHFGVVRVVEVGDEHFHVDVIVTGDKLFLSLGIEHPRIVTARDFLDTYTDPA